MLTKQQQPLRIDVLNMHKQLMAPRSAWDVYEYCIQYYRMEGVRSLGKEA